MDDVFDGGEVWAARATPIDKKFDYEHIDNDIIGHITSVRACTPDMAVATRMAPTWGGPS